MHGIILAAGRGSRLGDVTDQRPKGMVEVGGHPFLEWQHAAMKAAGVNEITVITGYLGEVIRDWGFHTIENPDWSRGNMISSLVCALKHIEGPLIVSYSDIIYSNDCLECLINETDPIALTYDKNWLDLWSRRFEDPLSDAETFKVADGKVLKEIGSDAQTVEDIEGQFMGLLKINPEGRRWIEELIDATPEARLGFDTTTLLQTLIETGCQIKAVGTSCGWCEIDSVSDLRVADNLVSSGSIQFPNANTEAN